MFPILVHLLSITRATVVVASVVPSKLTASTTYLLVRSPIGPLGANRLLNFRRQPTVDRSRSREHLSMKQRSEHSIKRPLFVVQMVLTFGGAIARKKQISAVVVVVMKRCCRVSFRARPERWLFERLKVATWRIQLVRLVSVESC